MSTFHYKESDFILDFHQIQITQRELPFATTHQADERVLNQMDIFKYIHEIFVQM